MNGRIALVTGGSRGIGRAIAMKLAQDGCDVAILYAGRREAADETVALLEQACSRALAIQCNVAMALPPKRRSRKWRRSSAPSPCWSTTPVSCATVWPCACPSEDFRAVLDVNLTGAFHMIRACLPLFNPRRAGALSTSPPFRG